MKKVNTKFGSQAWQIAQVYGIRQKMKKNETLSCADEAFIAIEAEHLNIGTDEYLNRIKKSIEMLD